LMRKLALLLFGLTSLIVFAYRVMFRLHRMGFR
jgi:hypothetical protein